VGASVSETAQSSKEEAQLRGKLLGKSYKRGRTDDMLTDKGDQDDTDEEESRAGAIRKKAKIDPFAFSNGKNKQKRPAKSLVPDAPKAIDGPASSPGPSKLSQPTQATMGEDKGKFDAVSAPKDHQGKVFVYIIVPMQ
jgi:hypothetical protein